MDQMDEFISLDHGAGGIKSSEIIEKVFMKRFGMESPLTDSAILPENARYLAFTTDSYVVDPIFFPGGDIGKLAVCGTVNDLSVSGAIPRFLSASFIIEEGFPIIELERIADSMACEATGAGIRIVTGDTKVVEKGTCDKLFINTSGIGEVEQKHTGIASGRTVRPGDRLIVNGNLGDHAVAILGARNQLGFSTRIISDCACLNHLVRSILGIGTGVRFMRDLTRGGLASTLHELVKITGLEVNLLEECIPVDEAVRGLCEIMGFDPLYMANEGKLLMVVSPEESGKVMEIMRADPLGGNCRDIGEIGSEAGNKVIMTTIPGGKRYLERLDRIQLPRIC